MALAVVVDVAAAVVAAVDSDVAWSTFLREAKYFATAKDSSSFEIAAAAAVVVAVDETMAMD